LVCQAVEKQIVLLSDKEILDFGGGTGLFKEDIFRGIKGFCFVIKIMFHAFSLAQRR